jgi:PAS domain-containing protein
MAAPPIDGYIEQDARGTITGCSAESERLFGWPRAGAIGMCSHRLIARESILGRNFKISQNPGRHAKTVEIFNSEAESLLIVVNDILDFSMTAHAMNGARERWLYASVEE